ncbi:MAG TPA: glutaminyl-peptide cyclotransferase [Bacteroidia bacterium]|nr:glutaminyl-peptide cyclotransferase [Bacteroidia bacterium]
MKHKQYTIGFSFLVSCLLFLSCSDENRTKESAPVENESQKKAETPRLNYTLVAKYPHDSTCYTQGFLFHEGQLLESTGAPDNIPYTRSLIGIVDLNKGKMTIKAEIDRNRYFGEGIAVLNGKLFQLTYKNQVGFIYDAKTFQNKGQFGYINREGWGLTTDGKHLIMSDGTNALTFLDPETLSPVRTLLVSEHGFAVDYLNELEYIRGYIYANIYTKHTIVKIDPESGNVVAKLDIEELFNMSSKRYERSAETNGIAYDPDTDKIYVTGKLWPYIFEIAFPH